VSHIDMMTAEEASVVKLVCSRFMESECINEKNEKTSWGDLDCVLDEIGWLSDQELIEEAHIRYEMHKKGKNFRCYAPHKQEDCFAPFILEAVGAILSLNSKTKDLHPKNRYILIYYISMAELMMIFEES
jgi:hypothetical protein